jgi:adenylate kinase
MENPVKKFDEFLNERELPDKQGKIIVILGAPGSGKGTLSKELKDQYGFQHISTGDVLRKSEDDELKKLSSTGKLVPDDLMLKVLRKELKKLDLERGIIFDGFPRTIVQAKKLDRLLGKLGVGLNHAVLLSLPDEIAKERIRERAKTSGRKDDAKDSIIEKRFDEYREKTEPLVDFYNKSRKLITIKADAGKDEVLKKAVRKLGAKKIKI